MQSRGATQKQRGKDEKKQTILHRRIPRDPSLREEVSARFETAQNVERATPRTEIL